MSYLRLKITQFVPLYVTLWLPLVAPAGDYQLYPSDKATLFRQPGESVYVACKKNHALTSQCIFDCGNGTRFEGANGHCTFLQSGLYNLNIYLQGHSNKFHTVTVNVKQDNKKLQEPVRKHIVKNAEKNLAKKSQRDTQKSQSDEVESNSTVQHTANLNFGEKVIHNNNSKLISDSNTMTIEQNNYYPVVTPDYLLPSKEFEALLNNIVAKQRNDENRGQESDEDSGITIENITGVTNSSIESYGFQGEARLIEGEMHTIKFSNIVTENAP